LSSVGGFGAAHSDHAGVATIGPSGPATSADSVTSAPLPAAPGLTSGGSDTIASTRGVWTIASR